MNSIKTFFSGFRRPDLSKLWHGSGPDEVDDDKKKLEKETPLAVKLEAAVVKFQVTSVTVTEDCIIEPSDLKLGIA